MLTRFFFIALFLLTAPVAFGQSRPAEPSLPTYRQIKPASQELYDYVPPRGTAYQSVQRTFGLFDYPDGAVTYVVNGEIVSKATDVQKRLTAPGVQIDSLSISPPDAGGKRLIRVRLLPTKQ